MFKSLSFTIKRITDVLLFLCLVGAICAMLFFAAYFVYRDHGIWGLFGAIAVFVLGINWMIWSAIDD